MKSQGKAAAANGKNPLQQAIAALRRMFISVGLFSAAINILMLTGSVFMLQIYDRVLASRSVPTLIALSAIAALLYLFLGFFEFVRTRVTARAGYWLADTLNARAFRIWMARGLAGRPESVRPLNDIGVVRQFLGSPALSGLFDLPWVPFYLAIVFALHVWLGALTLFGAVFVAVVAIANEYSTRKALAQAMIAEAAESRFIEQSYRNAESILPMGMLANVEQHWKKIHGEAAGQAQNGAEKGEGYSATSKTFRMMLQSAILALGAWLAIRQEISAGSIVAASIIGGRALAPIDQVIGQWRMITRARLAYRRLEDFLGAISQQGPRLQLPDPQGRLQLKGVTRFAPDTSGQPTSGRRIVLNQISFQLEPGDGLGVIGPSASGKSTLARVLVGAWAPDGGSVRLDGASLDHWDSEALGRHIGYLPQSVELIAGTVQQNIARFDPEAKDTDIVEAAQIAGVHEMILRLPDGYATLIGYGATPLSGGQIQRIGLARALFRKPKLIVLDEPNANLDADGDNALTAAIETMRAQGSVVIVMAHRPSAIAAVNKLLMLSNGAMVDFGEKNEVLRKVTRQLSAVGGGQPGASHEQ